MEYKIFKKVNGYKVVTKGYVIVDDGDWEPDFEEVETEHGTYKTLKEARKVKEALQMANDDYEVE